LKKDGPRFKIGNVRALAVILLAPLFALGVVSVAVGIVGGVVREPARPTAVVWSQRVFTSQKELAAWLEARGSSYETWTNRHPSLASVFERQTPAAAPTDRAVAAQAETHRRSMLLAPLVAGIALLVLLVFALPRSRYRRRPGAAPRHRRREARSPRQLRARETATPAFAAVRASASFVAQAGRAHSPNLRSVVRGGMESIADIHDVLSSPRRRRMLRGIVLYAAYAIFAIALGASVAIYFP
jgi:hypothetical protein